MSFDSYAFLQAIAPVRASSFFPSNASCSAPAGLKRTRKRRTSPSIPPYTTCKGHGEKCVKILFIPDNTQVMATPGERLSEVARRAGVEIVESCGVGDCGTCEVLLRDEVSGDGFYIKSCIAKISSHKEKLVIDTVGDGIPPW
ncbi:unnamed protein product [Chondrus crispus]|uniref:2Fe-2S ferredoxin-type domain-containing protein n=1 Tax=Chondrus crispus TaxID=2769 RepID=R7QLQ5_CHOCR|nr:unnamed protein product [Chondrus crispus]CDF38999.1 unnamed protein product [Chondrus crispus]|eukprot:XP_005718904.1 unnamed protein product [Chondrus crispus]